MQVGVLGGLSTCFAGFVVGKSFFYISNVMLFEQVSHAYTA